MWPMVSEVMKNGFLKKINGPVTITWKAYFLYLSPIKSSQEVNETAFLLEKHIR